MNIDIVSDFLLVLVKILSMFFVMFLGWIMRRGSFLDDNSTTKMGRMMLNFVFPALVFPFMLKTITHQVMRESWYIPVFGFLLITTTLLTAAAVSPLFAKKERIRQFIFLAGSPNWIFLPLPIVEGLFGADGVRTILLYNAGAQTALWTLGIVVLRGGKFDAKMLKALINPGLIAIVAGIFTALMVPGAHQLASGGVEPRAAVPVLFVSLLQATEMVGSLTIPLALLVIGSRLGGLKTTFSMPDREYVGIMIARLIAGPVVFVLLIMILNATGLKLPHMTIMVGYLISCMPVAVTTIVFVEHFGGDRILSARVIFDSTLFSIITVPIFYYIGSIIGI